MHLIQTPFFCNIWITLFTQGVISSMLPLNSTSNAASAQEGNNIHFRVPVHGIKELPLRSRPEIREPYCQIIPLLPTSQEETSKTSTVPTTPMTTTAQLPTSKPTETAHTSAPSPGITLYFSPFFFLQNNMFHLGYEKIENPSSQYVVTIPYNLGFYQVPLKLGYSSQQITSSSEENGFKRRK